MVNLFQYLKSLCPLQVKGGEFIHNLGTPCEKLLLVWKLLLTFFPWILSIETSAPSQVEVQIVLMGCHSGPTISMLTNVMKSVKIFPCHPTPHPFWTVAETRLQLPAPWRERWELWGAERLHLLTTHPHPGRRLGELCHLRGKRGQVRPAWSLTLHVPQFLSWCDSKEGWSSAEKEDSAECGRAADSLTDGTTRAAHRSSLLLSCAPAPPAFQSEKRPHLGFSLPGKHFPSCFPHIST